MTDVAGKTVLITGASRGIGAAAARVFADAGANVVLVARNREAVTELAGQRRASGPMTPAVSEGRNWLTSVCWQIEQKHSVL